MATTYDAPYKVQNQGDQMNRWFKAADHTVSQSYRIDESSALQFHLDTLGQIFLEQLIRF